MLQHYSSRSGNEKAAKIHQFDQRFSSAHQNSEKVLTVNFKTKKCRHFELGRCRLGDNCNFAHGDDEIGLNDRRPEKVTLISSEQLCDLSMSKEKYGTILLNIETNLERMISFQKGCLQNLKLNTATLQNHEISLSQRKVV